MCFMNKMKECIFCDIAKKKINSEIVFENDKMIAFLDINPVNYGHTLLIPKEHYDKMENLDDKILGEMFVEARNLMKKIKKKMKANYVALSVVGVDVNHFHIHLIPRYFNL